MAIPNFQTRQSLAAFLVCLPMGGPTHQMCSQVPVLVSFLIGWSWLHPPRWRSSNWIIPFPPVFLCYFPKFVHSTPTLVGCRHPSCTVGGRALIWSFQPLRKIVSSLGCKLKTHLKNRTVLSFHVSEAAFHKAQPPSTATGTWRAD